MQGFESWVAVGEDKVPTRRWKLEERDVTKPRPDGSRYIGNFYAQLTVDCALLKPGCAYTFFLKEPDGKIWRIDGTVQRNGLIDCRIPMVPNVNDSSAGCSNQKT